MKQYHALLTHILNNGADRPDRTQTGTKSVFGYQMRFDLSAGFPLVTTKKINTRAVFFELLWFIQGKTDIGWLNERNVRIWDKWADEDGRLGCIYGEQWRSWPDYGGGKIDQLSNVIEGIKTDPFSRRHIVSAWNPAKLKEMKLPPCHTLFQFYIAGDRLSCQLYQRSGDVFIGVPFNIASYSLLTMMVASVTGYKPGEFVHTFGDVHLYSNHLDQAREQLKRDVRPLPTLRFRRSPDSILEFEYEDFVLEGYEPHPHIPAPVAV